MQASNRAQDSTGVPASSRPRNGQLESAGHCTLVWAGLIFRTRTTVEQLVQASSLKPAAS